MIKKLLIKKYYKEKLSFSKIAILLGITPQAIYYWFKKYNLKPRNNSESKKGELHPNYGKKGKETSGYKTGIYCQKHYCLDCDKELRSQYAVRCFDCSIKYNNSFFKEGHLVSDEIRKKISLSLGGTGILYKNRKDYMRDRRKVDSNFRLLGNLRHRLNMALKNDSKSARTMKLIGCSIDFLKQHLEKQFKSGMSWSNYGKWHIDHIKPCASFDLSKPSEQRKCFNYINLQPLWAEENLRKNKY